MEASSRDVRCLTLKEIVETNCRLILETGGLTSAAGSVINPGSLHYLVGIVKAQLEGRDLFPSLADKAALYAFKIITDHIFADGNKRTGMFSAFWFLRLNGCRLSQSISEDEVVDLALRIATRRIDFEGVRRWFQEDLG